MTSPRKPASSIPVKAEDPYTLKLPGGHTAKFYKPSELTPRMSRQLGIMTQFMVPRLRAAMRAHTLLVGGEVADINPANVDSADLELSYEDVDNSTLLGELAAATYLKSWTLKRSRNSKGEPIAPEPWPLPRDSDGAPDPSGLLDISNAMYGAIVAHAAKLWQMENTDGFSADGMEDPESPTGDSDI